MRSMKCGRVEDPAENVFVGLVNTSLGNFRIFEGLREGTSFYLQLILDVLETVPRQEHFDLMRRSVDSLLKLSEAVANARGSRSMNSARRIRSRPFLTRLPPVFHRQARARLSRSGISARSGFMSTNCRRLSSIRR